MKTRGMGTVGLVAATGGIAALALGGPAAASLPGGPPVTTPVGTVLMQRCVTANGIEACATVRYAGHDSTGNEYYGQASARGTSARVTTVDGDQLILTGSALTVHYEGTCAATNGSAVVTSTVTCTGPVHHCGTSALFDVGSSVHSALSGPTKNAASAAAVWNCTTFTPYN